MKRIVALDPGGTTGVVSWTFGGWRDPATQDTSGPPEYFVSQIGPQEHHEELFGFLELQCTDDYTVVCESFEFRQGKQRAGINLVSKEYIGVVKLFAQQRPQVRLIGQTAAQAKGFVTDEKLKAMGLYAPGHRHAMDAMRHLITYRVQRLHHHSLIESWKNL